MTKLAILALLMLPATSQQMYDGPSESAGPDPLEGRYVLRPDPSDDPSVVVEDATRDMGRLARRRARGRLIEVVRPADSLAIEVRGDTVVIARAPGATHRVVVNGESAEHRTDRGDVVSLSATREGDTLVVTTYAESAEKTQRFIPVADGLRVEATYTHDALTEPLRLVSSYRREQ